MSPSVGNFVHDLVEMAKAMETLPQVQRELDNTLKANADLLDRIQSLELKLIERANEIDALHAKIREAEQARDQAETMFLEESDRTASFKSFVENLFGTAGNLLKASAPTTPLAVPEVEQVQEPARLSEPMPQTEVPAQHWYNEPIPSTVPAYYPETDHGTPVQDFDASGSEPSAGPYTGKWYSDHPTYVPLPDWLAGGGTEETYFGNQHAPRFG